ncbi:hypothetical protein POM88_005112 [Heracleum sosnowskyi]|uniref:Methyltransferase n=1 Tax=Heracleum sosnowskyi TaxID=360622 RepID=A0AAD8JN23_9APIA|nr:hypothetical protein POM88_005112 [Heracleum sosnowskyi]
MIKMLSFFFKLFESCVLWNTLSGLHRLKKCYSPRESICSYLKAQLIIIISHGESGINVRLLWLDKGSFLDKYRQAFQSEVINLAHSEMKNLVPADSDDLMSYERPARPILKDIIQVAVIPYDLAAKSYEKVCSLFWGKMAISDSRTLGLTLAPTHNADEGVKVIKSTGGTILEPGKNADSDDLMRVLQDYLEEETVVRRKTSLKKCYAPRKSGSGPPLCSKRHDIETPYYGLLQTCIGGTQSRRWVSIKDRAPWPARSNLKSNEIQIYGSWLFWNVLDMNARFGGFNSALLEAGKSVWVMNVVPTTGPSYIPLILGRGFVGVLHDWFEAFPTYPRIYDMVHATGLLSLETGQKQRCSMQDLFSEIDRLLRLEGDLVFQHSDLAYEQKLQQQFQKLQQQFQLKLHEQFQQKVHEQFQQKVQEQFHQLVGLGESNRRSRKLL